jgi:hypothetical protein
LLAVDVAVAVLVAVVDVVVSAVAIGCCSAESGKVTVFSIFGLLTMSKLMFLLLLNKFSPIICLDSNKKREKKIKYIF